MNIRHFFIFKQKTAYEMRISDWSSDVCSSDLSSTRTTIFSMTQLEDIGHPNTPRIWTPGTASSLRSMWNAQVPIMMLGDRKSVVVGKECVSTCRSRWSPYPYTKQKHQRPM